MSFILRAFKSLKFAEPSVRREHAQIKLLQLAQRSPSTTTQSAPPLFTSPDGLLRIRSRLHYATHVPYAARNPVYIPRDHDVARLLVLHFHQQIAQHVGGINHTLALFLQHYWTPRARALTTSIVKACVPCRKAASSTLKPPTAPLPSFRIPDLQPQPLAFATTAMDCAGPFRVKVARAYKPYYLLLLTCCQFRAVRLEFLSALSLDALLLALARVAARGVNPHTIVSDNGANFVAARALLVQLVDNLLQEDVHHKVPHITWKLNPPYASHTGGVFERLIGSAKRALVHVLPAHVNLTLEQLVTSFAHVEAILNSRPLSYVSAGPDSLAPLTPNHFLYGSASQPLFDAVTQTLAAYPAKCWNFVQATMKQFADRFAKEILPGLHFSTAKNSKHYVPLKVGDVVSFFMPVQAKQWPLAVVDQIYPGIDGLVRTVRLRVRNNHGEEKFYIRNVRKIILLLSAETTPSSVSVPAAAASCIYFRRYPFCL